MLGRVLVIGIVSVGSWAAGAEKGALRLTPTPIASPELILTGPARLATGSAGWVPLPDKGAKIPGEGESGEFTLADEAVSITWAGQRDFTITAGGKTQGLRPITRSYGLQPTTITLSNGRRYTLAFPVGQVGKTPEGTQAAIFYRSGASQNGMLDGDVAALYDANTDGVYEKGRDSLRVGPPSKPMMFAPATRYFATSKAVYELEEVAEDGTQIRYAPFAGTPGKLETEFASGNSELNLILLSTDGQMSAVATASSKVRPPLLLVSGEYRVKYGVVSLSPQGHITAVLQPASVEPITIEESSSAKLDFGGPYKLEFQPTTEGVRFRVAAESLVLSGKSGESYVNYRWSQPPDVSVQAGGTVKRVGRVNLDDGMFTEFLAQVPDGMGIGDRKVILSGVVEGLGPVKGEATLP